jgi:hypothetical protein
MQLAFNETVYKKAIGMVWDYWDGHDCDWNKCTHTAEYLSKAYDNPSPTRGDIGITQDDLVEIAEVLGIEDDEPYDEDDEWRYEINLLIHLLDQNDEVKNE